jgi:hypothetical protein
MIGAGNGDKLACLSAVYHASRFNFSNAYKPTTDTKTLTVQIQCTKLIDTKWGRSEGRHVLMFIPFLLKWFISPSWACSVAIEAIILCSRSRGDDAVGGAWLLLREGMGEKGLPNSCWSRPHRTRGRAVASPMRIRVALVDPRREGAGPACKSLVLPPVAALSLFASRPATRVGGGKEIRHVCSKHDAAWV